MIKNKRCQMSSRLTLYAVIVFFAIMHLSFRWPVENPVVTSTFGESRWDHFHDGIDVISTNRIVVPIAPGTLVFYWNKNRFPFDDYLGMGNYVVIDHGNDLVAIYGHLSDDAIPKLKYEEGDIIGKMGNTGHSFATHLHFTILKRSENKSINPLLILPPISDVKPPIHLSTWFRIGERYVPIREKGNYRITAHHPLLIEISDSIAKRERLGVYKLFVQLNDRTLLDVEFREISSSKNILTVQGLTSNDLFDERGFYRIAGTKYVEGENRLRIVATDFHGNRVERVLTFFIHLDIAQ
ncbi:MAG: M23 family metallopeptidase [Spirochaetes bacterium]|nr:M23 family metallopeptidase [Spirochaetota bacterium]